ncbi:(2Fe-2S)-binding protein [Nitriliruptor alkaliphilus]|uniref:(2Fe-2S)-binding protein n=1 Tax=Nitriliruptor alkaliphilus TaxID=427918 RepID=UPI000695C68D|nr:(2Fe-2S)-binding protein [Nitriliruptor alkaliphilus]
MTRISITVDGDTYEHDVEPRTLLVHHLRESCDRTGTNVGCDTSNCGACTVHMGGTSVKSCTILAVQADGEDIRTIQGMATPVPGGNETEGWHPLQKAFHVEHGLQCGFCTPGMIMASAALLEENPDPSEDQIRQGLEGNLCRCTGYVNIVRSVQRAAAELRGEPMQDSPEEGSIGQADGVLDPASADALEQMEVAP